MWRGNSTGQNPPTPFCFPDLILSLPRSLLINNSAFFLKYIDIGKEEETWEFQALEKSFLTPLLKISKLIHWFIG